MARRSVAVWITESVHLISADGCRRMSVSGCPWPVRARSANRTVFHPVDEWGIHMEVDLCNPLAQASRVMVMRLTGATTIQCGAVSPDRSFASTMNRTDNCPTSGREAAVIHETPEPEEAPLPGVMTVPPNDSPRRHEAERRSGGATSPRISGIWDRVSSPAVASVAGRTAGNSRTPIIRS